jgi:hypothetical protein
MFVGTTIRRTLSGIAVPLLLLVGTALAQDIDYRVSGTIVGVGGTSMAVIERRPEGSVIVAPGDEIDGGRVVEISERNVRLSFGDRDLLVPLNGAPAQAVAPLVPVSTPLDSNERFVSGAEFLSAIGQLSSTLPAQARGAETAGGSGSRGSGVGSGVSGGSVSAAGSDNVTAANLGEVADDVSELAAQASDLASDEVDPGEALAEMLSDIIAIPEGSSIRNINGEDFSSVREGLGLIEGYVAQDAVVRFEMFRYAEPGQPLYIFPE